VHTSPFFSSHFESSKVWILPGIPAILTETSVMFFLGFPWQMLGYYLGEDHGCFCPNLYNSVFISHAIIWCCKNVWW
jgi:hypothetical protein